MDRENDTFRFLLNRTEVNYTCAKTELKRQVMQNFVMIFVCCLNIGLNSFAYCVLRRAAAGLLSDNRQVTSTTHILLRLLRMLCYHEVLFQLFWLLHFFLDMLNTFDKLQLHQGYAESDKSFAFRIRMLVGFQASAKALLTAFHISRNWTVVLISWFRFELTSWPLLNKRRFFRLGRLAKMDVCVTMLALISSLPRLWSLSYLFCDARGPPDYRGHFVQFGIRGNKYFRQHFFTAYEKVYLFLVQNGGPSITICIFGVCVVMRLTAQHRFHKKLAPTEETGGLSGQNSAAAAPTAATGTTGRRKRGKYNAGKRLVVVLCICFVALEMPTFIAMLLERPQENKWFIKIANWATCLDSTLNIFIFTFSNSMFSKTLRNMISKRPVSAAQLTVEETNRGLTDTMNISASLTPRKDVTAEDVVQLKSIGWKPRRV